MSAEASFTVCTRETKQLLFHLAVLKVYGSEATKSHSQHLSLLLSSCILPPVIANLLPS